ncbi:uncharacterized protein BXZ73DRAFT_91257 [Epithele typhae]|uniref:uncharacterized protein n=1 Tax=Epithele typhae TaxID=378194 RepID=UPI002007E567|nr:uncharacterized protein BXZ73DRAFT_91257 [Epithele typhae]KAH9924690.1 hypothetical protein BXZ73DRAFT_91257 [Epithele typhae]
MSGDNNRPAWHKTLDESLYTPDEEEKAFMKATTGIQDDGELKRHIIAVQTRAFSAHKYPCIRMFEFMRLKIARLPAYPQFLQLGKDRKDAIFLDMGTCFGNDVRKTVVDGWPVENAIASDLHPALWEFGHELFRSTPATFPVPFLQGDILNPAFLAPAPLLPTSPDPPSTPAPALASVTSLTALHGRVSAVFLGAFFHLFTYDQQTAIARLLMGLLAPHPGAMLFGVQGGKAEKALWCPAPGTRMNCHCPDSWREMWEGLFADAGERCEVRARLRADIGGQTLFGTYPDNTDAPFHVLEWSVTRL